MRSDLPFPRLSLLLTALVLGGCNTAYREAMSRAREAALQGDSLTAAQAYREACRASPDDKDACGRFPLFAQKATDEALVSTGPACEAGDLDQCLPLLLAARDLIPEHAEVNARLEKASQLHIERCAKWKVDGPLTEAVAHIACLQSRGGQLPVPSYQTHVSDSAALVSSRFGDLAGVAQAQGSAGAASLLWSTAQCLAPGQASGSHVQQARQAFIEQSAIPVVAQLGGAMSRQVADNLVGLCERISSGMPAWARCAELGTHPNGPEPLRLQVDARIARPRETVSEDVRSVEYLSGTREVRNPAYQEARGHMKDAERAVDFAEEHKKKKDADCEKASDVHEATCVGCPSPRKKACDEAHLAAVELKKRIEERDDARRHLRGTPETLVEDVYDTFTYAVLHHRWSSDFSFQLQASTPLTTPPDAQSGELRFEDQEHVGFSPAGLAPDPLNEPPARAYADAFLQQLAPRIFAAVVRDAQVRGTARRADCNALPADWGIPWVQCWAESALWGSGQEPAAGEFLQVLATQANASASPVCR